MLKAAEQESAQARQAFAERSAERSAQIDALTNAQSAENADAEQAAQAELQQMRQGLTQEPPSVLAADTVAASDEYDIPQPDAPMKVWGEADDGRIVDGTLQNGKFTPTDSDDKPSVFDLVRNGANSLREKVSTITDQVKSAVVDSTVGQAVHTVNTWANGNIPITETGTPGEQADGTIAQTQTDLSKAKIENSLAPMTHDGDNIDHLKSSLDSELNPTNDSTAINNEASPVQPHQ